MTEKTYQKVKDNVYEAKDNFVDNPVEFFAAFAIDANGKAGLVAQLDLSKFPPVEKPMIGASRQDRDAILQQAKEAAKGAGVKIKVVRFTNVEVIAEFVPDYMN